jgi:hypothetical protein
MLTMLDYRSPLHLEVRVVARGAVAASTEAVAVAMQLETLRRMAIRTSSPMVAHSRRRPAVGGTTS